MYTDGAISSNYTINSTTCFTQCKQVLLNFHVFFSSKVSGQPVAMFSPTTYYHFISLTIIFEGRHSSTP